MSQLRLYQGSTLIAAIAALVFAFWPRQMVPMVVNTLPINDCNGTIQPTGVVRIRIESPFLAVNTPREVTYSTNVIDEVADENAAESEDASRNNTVEKISDYGNGAKPPPFHVDLSKVGNVSNNEYVMVRVVLNSPDYTFYTENNVNGTNNNIKGIGQGEVVNDFCGAQLSRNKRSAYFYVKKDAPLAGAKKSVKQPFNIGIEVLNVTETPVFIDPKIKNPGGDQ